MGTDIAAALPSSQLTGFIDSNAHRWNQVHAGRPIFSPASLRNDEWSERPFVIIGTMYDDEVQEQLDELGYRPGLDYATESELELAGPAQLEDWVRLTATLGREPSIEDLHGFDDEFWFWLNAAGAGTLGASALVAPLPSAAIQKRLTGASGRRSLRHGFNQYLMIKELLERQGRLIGDQSRILDFGAGYGRLLRFFRKDAPRARLTGTDIESTFVEWCRQNIGFGEWLQNQPHPPLPVEAASCNLVFAFSVFSHLSERCHTEWLTELRRVVVPGGLVILTVWNHPRTTRGYHEQHFPDYADIVRRYEAGEFSYSSLHYHGSETYGEALVPLAYIRKHWTRTLTLVDWVQDHPWSTNQNYVVLRRDA